MFLQIAEERRQLSLFILQWVTLSFRSLTLSELAGAISGEFANVVLSSQAIRDYIAICGPILEIDEYEDDLEQEDQAKNSLKDKDMMYRVHLLHQSAKEYILRMQVDNDHTLEFFRIKPEAAHLRLSKRCLHLIQSSSLQYHALNARAPGEESPLLRYSVACCFDHAASVSMDVDFTRQFPAFLLDERSQLRSNWVKSISKSTVAYVEERNMWNKPLHLACFFLNVPWARTILERKALVPKSLNALTKRGRVVDASLVTAVAFGHRALVHLLLGHGARVNARLGPLPGALPNTALTSAALRGDEAMVELLTDFGANVDIQTPYKYTALHFAALYDRERLIRLLVDRGAKLDISNSLGYTPLSCAVFYGYEKTVATLIDLGADMNGRSLGDIVLHLAARHGHVNLVKRFSDYGISLNEEGALGMTVLHCAAESGNGALMQSLIQRGADVYKNSRHGLSLLHCAFRSPEDTTETVQLALKFNSNVNVKCNFGQNALHAAAMHGNVNIAKLLIDHGADFNEKDVEKKSILHCACFVSTDAAPMVQLCVDLGLDVNAKMVKGQTPLHLAANSGKPQTAKTLLDNGANINAKDRAWFTALRLARRTYRNLGRTDSRYQIKDCEATNQLLRDRGAKE